MHTDRFGQAVTTASARAAALNDQAVDRLFALQPGGDALIDEALALDGEFALAHCTKARSAMMVDDPQQARRSAETACELARRLPERERRHAAIVRRIVHGDSAAALEAVLAHVVEYPRDAVVLSFALGVYGPYGFGGYNDFHRRQLALLERVAPFWEHDDWWFLAAYGWTSVEAGRTAAGIAMLDRALELNPANANAAHGRAHGFYEVGAPVEGAAFVKAWLPTYPRSAPLHGHLAWHLALFALQQGDCDGAFSIYNDAVAPSRSLALPMFTLIDSASFVARCLAYGFRPDAAERSRIASFAAERFPKAGLPFVNVHMAMAFAAAGRWSELDTHQHGVAELLAADRQPSGPVVARVCAAVAAAARGRYGEAGRLFAEAAPEIERLGGSHAQRDLLIDLLIAARLRAGARDEAWEVAQQRWCQRAPHLGEGWLRALEHRLHGGA